MMLRAVLGVLASALLFTEVDASAIDDDAADLDDGSSSVDDIPAVQLSDIGGGTMDGTLTKNKQVDGGPPICADSERKNCQCKGDVYYGLRFANGKPGNGMLATFDRMKQSPFKKKSVYGAIACSNAALGDPYPGFSKHCRCVPPPAATLCASAENKDCSCDGDVYFGLRFLDGKKPGSGVVAPFARLRASPYKKKSVYGSIKCSSGALGGDPLSGFYKHCYCEPAPEATLCADAENKDCSCHGDVYFGLRFLDGKKPGSGTVAPFARLKASPYKKKTISGSIKCSSGALGGDPLSGFYKHCFCVTDPKVKAAVLAKAAEAAKQLAAAKAKAAVEAAALAAKNKQDEEAAAAKVKADAAAAAAKKAAEAAKKRAKVAAKVYKSVSQGSNKKIAMVTSTLQDILQSVVNEEKQETEMFNKYVTWCDTEGKSIADDLSSKKTDLANTKVLSEEQVSSIDSLTLFVAKSEKEIEETKDAVAQAVALRTTENDEYTENMMLNTQSLRQIGLAIKHVSKVQKQGGFLQNGVLKRLAVNQPGESGYVLGIMKGLNDKLTKTRAELKKVEEEKVTMHNSFMETKGQTLKSVGDTKTAKKIELAETTAKEAGTKRKIGKLTEQVDQLTKQQAETSKTCLKTKHEWKVRQSDRTKEKAALNEAIRFLTQTAFEQQSLVQASTEDTSDTEEHDSVVFAPSFVQLASDSALVSANEFYAAAGRELMGEDDEVDAHMKEKGFGGVKNVVAKLITTHQDTGAEEKTKKAYCEKEIATNEDAVATTTDDLAAVKANIDKKSAEVEQLGDEVKNMYKSIDKIKTALEAADKLRKEENALFTASSKDRALALKVLKQAKTVLQDFYEKSKGNLLQAQRGEAPPPTMPRSSQKSAASFGAVSMVQDIMDDIAKEQKDSAIGEQEAVTTYTKLQKDSRTQTDETHQDITDRVTAKAKLGVQINTYKETQTQKNDELKSLNQQNDSLHKSCDELLKFFDKRVKGRTFEISQLRDVMDILSGSSIAARTGLMQEQDDAGADVSSEEGGEAGAAADSEA